MHVEKRGLLNGSRALGCPGRFLAVAPDKQRDTAEESDHQPNGENACDNCFVDEHVGDLLNSSTIQEYPHKPGGLLIRINNAVNQRLGFFFLLRRVFAGFEPGSGKAFSNAERTFARRASFSSC